jgi:hypothetical protein
MQQTAAQSWLTNLDHSDYRWPGWVRSPETVADWIKDLTHPDDLVRAHAARALAQAGRLAEPAVPRLERLLHDPKTAVRFAAAHALQQITAARGRKEEREEAAAGVRAAFPAWVLGLIVGVPFLLGLMVLARLLHALWPYLIHP